MESAFWFWIFAGTFILISMFFGFRGYFVSEDIQSYSIPQGKLGVLPITFSTAASYASPATFLGTAGFVYVAGLSGLWWQIVVPFAFGLGLVVVSKNFTRIAQAYGSISLPEWMGDRFDSDLLRLLVSILYFLNIFYIVGIISGMGHLVNVLGNIPYSTGILLMTILVIIRSILGGNYGVVKSDFYLGILMIFGAIVILFSGFWFFSSISEINLKLAEQSTSLIQIFNRDYPLFNGPIALIGLFLAFFAFAIQPHIANRFLMLPNKNEFRKFILLSSLLVFIYYLSITGGLYARVLIPGIEMPDQANLRLISEFLPSFLTGITGVAILAAGLSTIDSILIAMGTVMGNDIYKKIIVKYSKTAYNQSEFIINKKTLIISRITVLLTGIIAAYFALNPPFLLAILSLAGIFGFVAGALGPFILSLFWPGATKYGALCAVIVGPTVHFALYYSNTIPNVFLTGSVAIACSTLVMLVVSFVTPKPLATLLDKTFNKSLEG